MSSLTNNRFTYKSNVPNVKYALSELEKAALKEIGKFVTKTAKANVDEVTEKRTGLLRRKIGYWIKRKDKSVQVGVRKEAFYGLMIENGHRVFTAKMKAQGYYINKRGQMVQRGILNKMKSASGKTRLHNLTATEFGGSTVPARPFLTPAAQDHISEIREIAAKYIKEIEKDTVTINSGGDE